MFSNHQRDYPLSATDFFISLRIAFCALLMLACSSGAIADPPVASEYSNARLTMKIAPDDSAKELNKYTGDIRLGDQTFPFKATLENKTLRGAFSDKERDEFPFVGTLEGTNLIFVTGGTTYKLEARKQAGNLPDSPLHGPGYPYEGIFKDEKITVDLSMDTSVPGGGFIGKIINGKEVYTIAADRFDGILKGKFKVANGDVFAFTAEMKDAVLELKTGDTTYFLKRPLKIANPLLADVKPTTTTRPVRPLNNTTVENAVQEPIYIGIGVQIRYTSSGDWLITGIVPESPAANADIRVNDMLISVNGKAIHRVENPGELLRGNIGSSIKIGIERVLENGVREQTDYTLLRAELKGPGK